MSMGNGSGCGGGGEEGNEMVEVEGRRGVEMVGVEGRRGVEMVEVEGRRGVEMVEVEGRRGVEMVEVEVEVEVAEVRNNSSDSVHTHQITKKTKPVFGSFWQIAHRCLQSAFFSL
jgi:hypothetical protein